LVTGPDAGTTGVAPLPSPLTPFVGRAAERAALIAALREHRLVTAVGPGGVGKTRLALSVAADVAGRFADGACYVDLVPVTDALMIAPAIADALGLGERQGRSAADNILGWLAERETLLVLDNCEHLLDGCATLAGTLIASCPELHVLATSRQALGVAGEVRMAVPPMSLPEGGDGIALEQLVACDAVGLLAERAGAVVPGFAVSADNAAAVAELCRRLDGIPLALELAAVRLGSLSLDQLNRGLASELAVLGGGNRGAEARQQTLEAAIGWSYGLLGEQERLL
jgi:predicted ATPase